MKRNIVSYISILISLFTLFLFWSRLEPITIEWMGVLIGILAILTTVLIGWNIFIVIDFKKLTKEIELKHLSLVNYSETNLLMMYKTSADFAIERNNIFGIINNSIFAIDIAIRLGNLSLAESLLNRILEVAPDTITMNSFYKSMLTKSFYSIKNWNKVNGYERLEFLILNIKISEFSEKSQLDFL
ncbi:MAG: hypothetical protein BGO40_03505 [Chryseobacterium sp. 39-10]|nr:MAG: hypothetical protein BGO40_03505 [Chryseobacterium sp. 39-10]